MGTILPLFFLSWPVSSPSLLVSHLRFWRSVPWCWRRGGSRAIWSSIARWRPITRWRRAIAGRRCTIAGRCPIGRAIGICRWGIARRGRGIAIAGRRGIAWRWSSIGGWVTAVGIGWRIATGRRIAWRWRTVGIGIALWWGITWGVGRSPWVCHGEVATIQASQTKNVSWPCIVLRKKNSFQDSSQWSLCPLKVSAVHAKSALVRFCWCFSGLVRTG